MKIKDLIRIKAELLCWGLRYNKEAQEFFREQNPHFVGKTGNIGLHILLENKLTALVSTTHRFDQRTPYKIKQKNKTWILLKEGKEVCKIKGIKMPNWYSKKTNNNTSMSNVFFHEGIHFLHQCYEGCGYFQIKKPCKFCATGPVCKIPAPKDVGETAEQAYKENPKYHVCLGGGTPISMGKGAEYFLGCITQIRKRVKEIPIWVEITPPDKNKYIQMMIDAGANSFGLNLEIWDDKLRKEICPGKFQISRGRYLEAFNFITEKLGKNRVGTVLIAGLEPKESTVKGAKIMSQKGVRVCILPFKPWDGSAYSNRKPCNPEDLLWIGKKVAKFMLDNKVDPKKCQGCSSCPSCTIEEDLMALIKG